MNESTFPTLPQFRDFPKIARLNRDIVVSEKLDGSNVAVIIEQAGANFVYTEPDYPTILAVESGLLVSAQSREIMLTLGNDLKGFAAWVKANARELVKLGPGHHFGEWWGAGVTKRYSQYMTGKKFSLFNVARWGDPTTRPSVCDVVPVLYKGPFSQQAIQDAVLKLKTGGSVACPGCPKPEGVVVFHTAANTMFKVTVENDEKPKGAVE